MDSRVHIIRDKIRIEDLKRACEEGFGDMAEAVVDLEKRIIGIGGYLHSDIEEVLLAQGSRHEALWGINLYPGNGPKDRIEYTAMINIRPRQKNFAMDIADKNVRDEIRTIVESLVLSSDENMV